MVAQRKWRRLPAALKRRGQVAAGKTRLLLRSAMISKVISPAVYSPRLSRYEPHQATRQKPRLLLLRHRYQVFGDERSGNSNDDHWLAAPLKAANFAEVVEYYYDLDHSDGLLGDSGLVDLVMQTRPDLMILMSYGHRNSGHPNFDVLRSIREKCRIPLVAMWPDSVGAGAVKYFSHMTGAIDLNIPLDSGNLAEHCSNKSKFIRLWTPVDVRFFKPGDGPRDIPVSFVGSTEWFRSVREDYLGHLRKQGVAVYQAGGRGAKRISLKQYAEILGRSKISLNFSWGLPGTHALHGRVFETMFSGALLVENRNSETPQFFDPMSDYVVFDTKEDLVEKVRYYLEHEDERQRIALCGHQKALEQYNHNEFWAKVMGKLQELGLLPAPLEWTVRKTPIAQYGYNNNGGS